jgi:hypothetical protein
MRLLLRQGVEQREERKKKKKKKQKKKNKKKEKRGKQHPSPSVNALPYLLLISGLSIHKKRLL